MSDKNKLVSDAAKDLRDQTKAAKTQAKLEAVTFRKERETQLISEARKVYMEKLDGIYSGKLVVTPNKSIPDPLKDLNVQWDDTDEYIEEAEE